MQKRTKDVVILVAFISIALNSFYNCPKVKAREKALNSFIRVWGKDRYETSC